MKLDALYSMVLLQEDAHILASCAF